MHLYICRKIVQGKGSEIWPMRIGIFTSFLGLEEYKLLVFLRYFEETPINTEAL